MISFPLLGKHYKLGNQLFQYAFLRSTALRLGVKFYCPEWIGDSIFLLNDKNEREQEPINISKVYFQDRIKPGFSKNALNIEDGTEIQGLFQSEKYFEESQVRNWYTFREESISKVMDKYKHIDFSQSVGMHFRFGENTLSRQYIIPHVHYYKKALEIVKHKGVILVFSDEIDLAREYLEKIKVKPIYVEGGRDYEDLYLMTLCHDFISSVSTFSWWGAWLIKYEDKSVVCPKEWVRPGHPAAKSLDLTPERWVQLRAARFLIDNYYVMRPLLCVRGKVIHFTDGIE